MIVFFPNQPNEGNPLSMAGIAAGLRAIEKALGGISVDGGYIDWQNGVPKIIIDIAQGWRDEEIPDFALSDGGADLPPGGEEYQVLQRQKGEEWEEGDPLDAVWDWVRWP